MATRTSVAEGLLIANVNTVDNRGDALTDPMTDERLTTLIHDICVGFRLGGVERDKDGHVYATHSNDSRDVGASKNGTDDERRCFRSNLSIFSEHHVILSSGLQVQFMFCFCEVLSVLCFLLCSVPCFVSCIVQEQR